MGNTITNVTNPVAKKIINNITDNISANSINTCSSLSNNTQIISFGDINTSNCVNTLINNIENSIKTSVSASCLQSSDFKNLMKNSINKEIDRLKSSGQNQLADDVSNTISKNLDINQISSCMATTFNSQKINFGNINIVCPDGGNATIENISQSIVSNLLLNCVQTNNPNFATDFNNMDSLPKENISAPSTSSELSQEAIIGISVGISVGVILLIVILLIIRYFYKRT